MILTKTPFRVSLFGGGTDYEPYYREHGGAVLGFAIDKYCRISLRKLPPFFDYRHRVVYSEIELVRRAADIRHPVVREAFLQHAPYGFELHHDGDLPARSGLGSSSSFTVGLLHALHAFKGHMSSRQQLATEATHLERDVLGENVGSQDQIWAAYGGFSQISFSRDGTFDTQPIVMTPERKALLNGRLMLFFTGLSRFGSEIAGAQIANFPQKQRHLARMLGMVSEARSVLESSSGLSEIGGMLHETWQLKRDLADGVSTPDIDDAYAAALAAGAAGGKLLGAGGGGFLLLYVPEAAQDAVRQSLHKLVEVSFQIGAPGSQIVIYEPEGL